MKNATSQGTLENQSHNVESALDSGRKFMDEAAGEYTAKIREGYSMAKQKAKIASDQVNDFVQKHPLVALGTALCTGLMVGRIFASRSNKGHMR